MLQEILWLDGGDIIIRGTGTQNQYNYVTPNWTLFLKNVFQLFYAFCTIMESLTARFRSYSSCLVLVNGKQQFLCGQLPNGMVVKLSRHQCHCFAFSYIP